MKKVLKLLLCFGMIAMATASFAQPLPDPTGIDYCDCLDGVQLETEECPCTSTNTNNNNNNNNNTNEGPPNEEGDGPRGGIPEGNFPLVISWLECFFDPDC